MRKSTTADHTTGLWTRRGALTAGAALAADSLAPGSAAPAAPTGPARTDGAGAISTPRDAVAATTSGPVRGFKRSAVYIFKGIPYGDDTSGAHRFMPPRPPRAWQDPRWSLTYGPVAPQPMLSAELPEWRRFLQDDAYAFQSEDCLRINVWSTQLDRQARLPVMVWLHGGGFFAGSAHETPAYDGENLARQGVVVVSLNHRLGALGFLNLSKIGGAALAPSGNVGMLDLVQALQWVRDNIAAFGGDPGAVTIFGQSGGGGKVSTLMAMPAARGLFQRAIVMSGSFAASAQRSDEVAAATMTELGLAANDIDALRAIEFPRLIGAANAALRKLSPPPSPGAFFRGLSFAPVVDGEVLPENWERSAPSLSAAVPMIIGNVRDEFRDMNLSFSDANLAEAVPPPWRAQAAGIIAALKHSYPTLPPTEIGAMIGGLPVRNAAVEQARKKHALGGAATYLYWFTWATPLLDGRIGVPHGLDIPAVFNNTRRAETFTGDTADARIVAAEMSAAFVRFARSGNPGAGWTPFEPGLVPTMVFDTRSRLENDPAGAARKLLS